MSFFRVFCHDCNAVKVSGCNAWQDPIVELRAFGLMKIERWDNLARLGSEKLGHRAPCSA